MLYQATALPQRTKREFFKRHRISIQVKTAGGKIHIGSEQGEVANCAAGSDGILLTDTTTGTGAGSTQGPYETEWRGELWYAAENPPVNFCVIDLGPLKEEFDYERFGTAVSRELDKRQTQGAVAN